MRFCPGKFVSSCILCAATGCILCNVAYSQGAYFWTISASSTDPLVNKTSFTPGPQYAYLWLENCDLPDPIPDGIKAAQFSFLSSNPANVITDFQPSPGWVNYGDPVNLALEVGGCPCGPMLAGTILLSVNEPGSLCLGPYLGGSWYGVDCTDDTGLWEILATGLNFGGVPCDKPIGACCYPGGSCVDGTKFEECVSAGGFFMGVGTTCESGPCGFFGACCHADGSCDDFSSHEVCTNAGGIFHGEGSSCATVKCSPFGACCFENGSCTNGMEESECESAGGVFQGLGTTCVSVQCKASGACCFADGSCTDGLGLSECLAAGGTLHPGATCASADCTPIDTNPYSWSISASSVDPYVHIAPATPGVLLSYLWLLCCPQVGMSQAEFGLVSTTPANVIFGFAPTNGFVNQGSARSLLLSATGCPCGPVLAGTIQTFVNTTGSLCIGPSNFGAQVTADCSSEQTLHEMDWTGLGLSQDPCIEIEGLPCEPSVSLEERSWGRIKATYR